MLEGCGHYPCPALRTAANSPSPAVLSLVVLSAQLQPQFCGEQISIQISIYIFPGVLLVPEELGAKEAEESSRGCRASVV